MARSKVLFLGVVAASCTVAIAACGGGGQNMNTNTGGTGTTSPTTSSSDTTTAGGGDDGEAQATRGAKLYADDCASCHGDKGEGSSTGPTVVGKEALPLDPPKGAKDRKVKFATALDVAKWVMEHMPADNPGSLKPNEYWDIMAFDLKANGVAVGGKHIDEKTAGDIKLH